MPIFYMQPYVLDKTTGLIIVPTPVWLTVDTNTRSLKIHSNDESDLGVYDIVIYGCVIGYTYT